MSSLLPTLPRTPDQGKHSDLHNADEKLASEKTQCPEGNDGDASIVSEDGASPLEERSHNFPWRYKGPALLCVLCFTLGSNWASSAISPLKSTIRRELKISNAQYGVIASADGLVNTILPVFSGIAIDHYGPEIGALVSSAFIMLGALVAAIGASRASFDTIVAGQIILGLGSTTIETSQSKLYSHWFYGKNMGLIFGIDIAWGRVTNTVSRVTSVPIMNGTGSWTWPFWVSCIMCAATLVLSAAFYIYAIRLPAEYHTPNGRQANRQSPSMADSLVKKWGWTAITTIPAAFWIIALSQIMQAGTVGAYNGLSADMIKQTRGTSDAVAGYTSGANQVIPILLTPVLGAFFDRFGRRMFFVAGVAALWVLVFALMGFTNVHALVPMILSGLALAFNALPFIASIPLLVPNQANIGLAFGIWKAFNNAGSVIMDVSTGAIQDYTPTGRNTYDNVVYFLIAMKAIDVFYGLGYHFLDKKAFGGVLRRNEAEQRAAEAQERLMGVQKSAPLRKPVKTVTYIGVALMSTLIVVAWVLYLVYSQAK